MNNRSSLRVLSMFVACISTQTLAASCLLKPTCLPDTACGRGEILLEWATDAPHEIKLDGVSLAVQRIMEDKTVDTINSIDATWWVIAKGPALLINEPDYVGSISPSNEVGAVTLNLFNIPNKYVDYAEALKRRRAFSGVCEGLF